MNIKLNKQLVGLLLILFAAVINLNAQVLCYSVAEQNGAPNYLFEYDPEANTWTNIGITGTDNIEAIAIDDATGIIYATDNGTLGTIDPVTAEFTIIGSAGAGNGALGLQVIDDIDGLTFDTDAGILYGSHRVSGSGPGTNDYLVQIDPATGALVLGAFGGDDYVAVEEVFDGTLGVDVYDVDDIAYNPFDGNLYAIQNDDGPGVLTIISPVDGSVIQIVYDMDEDDVEGLGFTDSGLLYATTGNFGDAGVENPNSFLIVDYINQSTDVQGIIDPTGTALDFESMDCISPFGCTAVGGALAGVANDTLNICIDADPDFVNTLSVSGNSGTFTQWVITNQNLDIIDLPAAIEDVDFNALGETSSLIWFLSYENITGLDIGNNVATQLTGCYEFSNSVTVTGLLTGAPCPCAADAGTIAADSDSYVLDGADVEICATPNNDANVPAGYSTIYVLTSGAGLVIEQTSATSCFTVAALGDYTIHTLVYDPLTLDLSIVVPGVTTGADVAGLLIAGGGAICGSLDVTGAPITVEEPCLADCGTITADTADPIDVTDGFGILSATPDGNAVVPAGFSIIYVLTSGPGLVIEQTNTDPSFMVSEVGDYTIHCLIYDTLTLDLSIVVPGVTTGFDVNGLLIQGGGDICASLDVAGATFVTEINCEADCGTITADTSDPINITNVPGVLSATPDGNAVIPAGYSTVYVLTSGPGLVIEQTNLAPSFVVTEVGTYTIHCLIYNPNTLDLSIVVPGVTTGFDVNSLLIQGGGTICASLDVAGATFTTEVDPPAGFVCFAVSNDGIPGLMEYEGGTNTWSQVGPTGVPNIEAIALDGVNLILYAENGGDLGTIDVNTGIYTLIGSAGTANGANGPIVINNIDGLTYDYTNNILWGSHRIDSDADNNGIQDPGTNDLLVQIDPATGQVIAGAFAGDDYAIIEGAFDGSLGIDVLDVDDIALDPETGQLFAIQNFDVPGVISEISPADGSLISVVYDVTDFDIQGLGFNENGDLYASTGDNGSPASQSSFIFFDIVYGSATVIGPIDVTNQYSDFEALDCIQMPPAPTCLADAGSLTADNDTYVLDSADVQICAASNGDAVIPAGYSLIYVLTSGANLVIEQVSATSCFTVDSLGDYIIHTLVYDPLTLDLGIVVPGVTTGVDVFGLLIDGGGMICGSLDVTGAPITVDPPVVCEPDCGITTAVQNTYLLEDSSVQICATPDPYAFVPAGYTGLFILTTGDSLLIQQTSIDACFDVTSIGDYTIHCLIYDPNTLDLSIVQPGVTTGADVYALLIDGGGTICASLDVPGAPITVIDEPCDVTPAFISADRDSICLGNMDTVNVSIDTAGMGTFTQFVITDGTGTTILGGPTDDTALTFDSADPGTCLIWAVTHDGTLNAPTDQVADLSGCFVLSNSLSVTRENCCEAACGELTAVQDEYIIGANGVEICATADGNSVIPDGYTEIFVLTSGPELVIMQTAGQPCFTVDQTGDYTIHCLVYDTATLDLTIVEPGVTTGFDVNALLIQGGGDICASLDVIGAAIIVSTLTAVPNYDTTSVNTPISIDVIENDLFPTEVIIKGFTQPTDENGDFSGSVTLNADSSSFTFDPELDATGTFCWEYCIMDLSDSTLIDTTEVCVFIPEPEVCEDLLTDLSFTKFLTPNGDLVNDTWDYSKITECCPNGEMIIFNRWGNVVHKSSDLSVLSSWDGTWDGDGDGFTLTSANDGLVPSGTYFYCLLCDKGDLTDKFTGFIEVINNNN